MPKEIKKINFVDEVYKQMEEQIISGQWLPEQKIPSENELCQMFKVSRNTVRSAIDKLKAIGVLVSEQGRGTFVNKTAGNGFADGFIPTVFLDNEEIIEILEFRKTIEVEAAGYAAVRSSPEDIFKIQQAYDEMCKSVNDNYKYSKADYKLHLCIVEASGNRIFIRIMYRLKDIIYSHLKEMNEMLGNSTGLERHGKVVEAIKMKDTQLARFLMEEHINININQMKQRICGK